MKLKVSSLATGLKVLSSSLKFSFPAHKLWARPFLSLLRGHREEIILRDPRQLNFILAAAEESAKTPGITPDILLKLSQLKEVLGNKLSLPGTKAQLKPSFSKKKGAKGSDEEGDKEKKKKEKKGSDDEEAELTETERTSKVKDWLKRGKANPSDAEHPSTVLVNGDASSMTFEDPVDLSDDLPETPDMRALIGGSTPDQVDIPEGLEKMQLVVKWGGESTHSSRYQSRDLGDAFKKDIMIMNKDVLNNVKIYTSSERRVINTAQIFAHALLGVEGSSSSSQSSSSSSTASGRNHEPCPLISHLIQRRDLLDDNNAGKEKMTEAKKKLKILLRPGESDKRPDLAWPKSFKKEPVEVVKVNFVDGLLNQVLTPRQEVIEQLTELRGIMRRNYENSNVDKIPQQRWCSGDSPWLFKERWEKIFEDWVGIKQEKFDPSRVGCFPLPKTHFDMNA